MPNKKASIILLIVIAVIAVFVLLGLLISNADAIQDWLFDHLEQIRPYRSTLSVSFGRPEDEACLETVFRQLDVEVRKRVSKEDAIEYRLASSYSLPDGWADRFGKNVALALTDPEGKTVDLNAGIESMKYDGAMLVIRLEKNLGETVGAMDLEKASLCIDGETVNGDVHYFPGDFELELPVVTSGNLRSETDAQIIKAVVSYYSCPSCSGIAAAYD